MFQTKRMLLATAIVLAAIAAVSGPGRADDYQVDPIHSGVVFWVKHFGVGFIPGRFNEVGGTCTFDEKNPSGLSLDVQVKTESLDTNNPKRDQHLKSPDFFSVKEFPTIAFKSKTVKAGGERAFEVTGDLTLHGVTKEVPIKLEHIGSGKDPRGSYRSGFVTTFTIRRSDFGMRNMLDGIGDEVRITVAFEGVRK